MNDAQIWTMIGAFTALMFGMMTVVSTLFIRVVRAEINGVRGDLGGEINGLRGELGGQILSLRGEMNAKFDGLRGEMNARFEAVDARFDSMDKRIDGIDRDVQVLMKRAFGLDHE